MSVTKGAFQAFWSYKLDRYISFLADNIFFNNHFKVMWRSPLVDVSAEAHFRIHWCGGWVDGVVFLERRA